MRPPLNRSLVLDAARQILIQEGLDAVSLRRVAGELGVTAPALYAYVKDKRDLLRGITELELGDLVARFGEIEGQDAVERLRAMALAYVDFARRQPLVFRAIFLTHPELAMDGPEGDAPIARVFQVGAAPVAELVQRHQLGERDPRLAALAFWTAVHGAAAVIVSAGNLDPAERRRTAETVIETHLSGMRRPLGQDAGVA